MTFCLPLGSQPLGTVWAGLGNGSGISGSLLLQQLWECPCCDTRPTVGHRNTSRKATCGKPPSHRGTELRASGLARLSRLRARGRRSEPAFYCGTRCTFMNRQTSNSRDTVYFHRARSKRPGLCHRFPPGAPQLVSSSPPSPPASPKGFQGRCHPLLVQAAHPHCPPGAPQHSSNPVNVKPGREPEEGWPQSDGSTQEKEPDSQSAKHLVHHAASSKQ